MVDPEEQKPGYLVVKRRRIRPRRIVVPASLVVDVSAESVTLGTTRQALDGYPDYEATVRGGEYRKPTPVAGGVLSAVYTPPTNRGYVTLRQRNVPESNVSVERGMDVVDATGEKVGEVEGLIADSDTREASYLVLRQPDPLTPRDRLVPADLAADAQGGTVRLRITAAQVQGLMTDPPRRQEGREWGSDT